MTVLDAAHTQYKIRMAGIDAPERDQAFGARSRRNLGGLVFNRSVVVEYEKRDRYGRLVGKVLVNGVDACLAQIQAGMAWHYKGYELEQSPEDRAAYARAEDNARAAHRGLWLERAPVPPWEYRHQPSP